MRIYQAMMSAQTCGGKTRERILAATFDLYENDCKTP